MTVCPACASERLDEIYAVRNVPVHSCILFSTRQAAVDYRRRNIQLMFCHGCGFVFNAAYDARVQEYSDNFEESQHFSQTFNRFARSLAETIAREHDLTGRTVLEIGCGKGEFLALLCQVAGCRGIGIDPGCRPERLPESVRERVTLIRDFYGPEHRGIEADLVLCRHTLEHIGPVGQFLASMRSALAEREDVNVFFETPDALRVLREGAFWDIYYEHCSYFSPGTHARAFRRAGFEVTALSLQFNEQYIVQTARPAAPRGGPTALGLEDDLEQVRAAAAEFPHRVSQMQQRWRESVLEAHKRGRRVVLWGGGSKAVSFVTTLGVAEAVDYVVDINPHKQGRFLPGAGVPVVSPEHMFASPPDVVIAMNPIYREEIARDLSERGVACELTAL